MNFCSSMLPSRELGVNTAARSLPAPPVRQASVPVTRRLGSSHGDVDVRRIPQPLEQLLAVVP